MLKKFKWYIKRLSVMSSRELLYRIHENYEEKILFLQCKLNFGVFSTISFSYKKFNFTRSHDKCSPLLKWCNISKAEQKNILDNKHVCFSWEWQWTSTKDIWNISLENGNKWPVLYYSEIPYRQGNKVGDLRLIWEPSRLQQLVNLSLLVDVDDGVSSEEISKKIVRQFEHWVENNPLLMGVHYISSMECSLRLLSVIIAFDNIRAYNKVPDDTWNMFLRFVWGNATYVSKRISLYSSAGNHTIAECSGLLYVAVLFPEFKESSRWKSLAEKILFSEFKRQVKSDGGGIEQAFCYQAFILDLFGLVIKLYERYDLSIPKYLLDLHVTSCEFLNSFSTSYEDLPSIGDSDNGYALSKYLNIIWNENSINDGLATFDKSGYSVINNIKTKQQIIFDHGDLGMAPSYGHGHADALSVTLKCADDMVFIDPGTYTYTGDLEWRKYFRSTRAHNTVTINGLDQSKQESSFIWSEPYVSQLRNTSSTPDGMTRLIAYHDGYKKLGIRHWRGIVFFPEGHLIVLDFLEGQGEFELELNWHLGVSFERIDNVFNLNTSLGGMALQIDGGDVGVYKGSESPILGWSSEKYGVKKSITTLCAKSLTQLPTTFITKVFINDISIDDEIINNEISLLRGWVT